LSPSCFSLSPVQGSIPGIRYSHLQKNFRLEFFLMSGLDYGSFLRAFAGKKGKATILDGASSVLIDDQDILTGVVRRETAALQVIEGWITRAAAPFRQRLGMHLEDVVQEAMLEITRLLERETFRGESSLKTYVWRITSHACINQLRKLQRHPGTDLDSISELAAPTDNSPFNQLMQKETRQMLLKVLAEMPPECRSLWKMIMDGLSYQEMSQEMGSSAGALRVKVLRCRQKAVAVRQQMIEKKESSQV
jgi:RNA polymerase sigma-70 factor (ECF subfamily)